MLLAIASAVAIKLLIQTGSFIPQAILWPLVKMVAVSIWINLVLAFFNLIPIPPLDGSRIITGLLPTEAAMFFHKMERFGFILLLLLFYTGIIPKMIMPITNFAHGLITG
ncbi:MAG: site-2 protease family protein [Thermodesulfobacteriota bacterium]